MILAFQAIAADDGVYEIAEDDDAGHHVRAENTENNVNLGKQLAVGVRDVGLMSIENDNSRFLLSFTSSPYDQMCYRGLAIVLKGKCWKLARVSRPSPTETVYVNMARSHADLLSRLSNQKLQLRRHPGHKLAVSFRAKEPLYPKGEDVMVELKVTNVGPSAATFFFGGADRGARDNSFSFVASRGYLQEPDVGEARNFGGLMSQKILEPGQRFSKAVNLSSWFKFKAEGTYDLLGTFRVEFWGDDDDIEDENIEDDRTIWVEYLTSSFSVIRT